MNNYQYKMIFKMKLKIQINNMKINNKIKQIYNKNK